MKNLLIAIAVFWGLYTIDAQENIIEIKGKTNINSFTCSNETFASTDAKYTLSNTALPHLNLDVKDFDCKHKPMTKDFQKTLRSDLYPNLEIKFLKIVKTQNGQVAQVQVEMMKKTKIYQISFTTDNNKLVGKKQVAFSDFGIQPPKKMGGTIVVKDTLDLLFSLAIK